MADNNLKILLIVSPARKDFYNQLKDIAGADLYILWHVHEKGAKDDVLLPFIKGQYFWNDYRTPYQLLRKVRPDKIIFFEIIDLLQIALIIAARSHAIVTFYLEHGAAGDRQTTIKRWKETSFFKNRLPRLAKRLVGSLGDVFSAKIFYYSVFKKFNSFKSYWKFFWLPFKMMGTSPKKILSRNIFRERAPDYGIVFSRINYENFELYTGLPKEDALLTGVPFFDSYYRATEAEFNHLVYIEHPYLEFEMLGWTREHHRLVAKSLNDFAIETKTKLYVKLHPFSNRLNWEGYGLDDQYVEILQEGDFTQLYLEAKLILGFSSSLITGLLCAKKNIVLLGWHPEPKIFGVNFSETGLCHVSLSPGDLKASYPAWLSNNLTAENAEAYANFLYKCNDPFDGRATERVLNAILTHEVS